MMRYLPEEELELGGYWTERPYRQFSAAAGASELTYTKHVGRSKKIWLVPTHGLADRIHVSGSPSSGGYGGRILTFKLDDDTTIDLKGPWNSNADSLYADTGVDLRNRHETWGLIGRHREHINNRQVICDLLYWDKSAQIGSFNRIEDLALKISQELDELVFYYSESYGGSHSGAKTPIVRDDRRPLHETRTLEEPYWDRYNQEFRSHLELGAIYPPFKSYETVPPTYDWLEGLPISEYRSHAPSLEAIRNGMI